MQRHPNGRRTLPAHRWLLGWVVGCGLVVGVVMGAEPVHAGVFVGPSCPGVDLVAGAGGGWRRPVVLVHGVESSADRWYAAEVDYEGNELDRTVIDRLAEIPRVALYVFDHRSSSVNWVDHPHLGQRLADAVICLSDGWRSSVDIVGHSMGGLVARWVADRPIPGTAATVGDRLGAVITIGSPHRGSETLTVAAAMIDGGISAFPAPYRILARTLLAVCGRAAAINLHYCPIPKIRVLESPAGRALRVGSPQLEELAQWPDTIQSQHIAGDARVTFGLFGRQLARVPIGDSIVSVASAMSGAAHQRVFTCESSMTRIIDLMRSACTHSRMPQYQATLDTVIATLQTQPQIWLITADSVGPVTLGTPLDQLEHTTGLPWGIGTNEYLGDCTTGGTDAAPSISIWSTSISGVVDAIIINPRGPDQGHNVITREGFRPGDSLGTFVAIYGESVVSLGPSGYGAVVVGADTTNDGTANVRFFFSGPGTMDGATPPDALSYKTAVGWHMADDGCSH